MKKEWGAAAILALGCTALALMGQNPSGGADALYALAAPFIWAGATLRALSLSGWAGNVLAILLYALVSLIPVWLMIKKGRRPRGGFSQLLLIAMSAYLFFLLYFMVNPSMIQTLFYDGMGLQQEAIQVEQLILCMFFYSLLIAFWVLGVMADKERIPLQLQRLMNVMGVVMIVSVFYINVANLKNALGSLPNPPEDNLGLGSAFLMPDAAGSSPAFDGFMEVVRFVFKSAPTLLMLTVLPMAGKLLKSLEQSFFSEENQRLAAAIGERCRLVILFSLGGMLVTNALQLLLARNLHNVNVSGQIPLVTLILSLAMMLLSRYLERSFAVYQENQMMI